MPKTLEAWRNGIMLDEKRTAPARVRVLSEVGEDTWLQIVLREGRKRQIRRVAGILGHPVKQLVREKIAFLEIGHWRASTCAITRSGTR